LFETSYLAKPLQFDEMLESIILAGYKPIFAHPERYRYITNFEDYSILKNKGVYFQVNINSFGGHYGKASEEKALFLSENGMIDFLGSDVHHIKQVKTLVTIKEKNFYKEIFNKNLILNNIL
jgi:tyrosine-protein phosphatase YwqE